MGDEHTGALMAAYAVAMSARTNQLTEHAVEDMRVKAEELLLKEHPAYKPILHFATMYEITRRDPAALAVLGDHHVAVRILETHDGQPAGQVDQQLIVQGQAGGGHWLTPGRMRSRPRPLLDGL